MSFGDGLSDLRVPYEQGVVSLRLDLAPDFCLVRDYLELLCKWNLAYNLTGVRKPEEMLPEYIFSSLVAVPFVVGNTCLDIGSGAGIPGLILAMALPRSHWTLIDSNGKKSRFMQQACMELQLKNVEVVNQRIQKFSASRFFSTIISRAWCSLPEFYQASARRLTEDGVMLAMKSTRPQDELDQVSCLARKVCFHELEVPGLSRTRGLVTISI